MHPNPDCPICGSPKHTEIGNATFVRGGQARNPYVALRLCVLFDLWCPGEDSVTISYRACETCGFVFYTPRPDEADLSAKYAYFSQHRIGAHHAPDEADSAPAATAGLIAADAETERERARRLYEDVRSLVSVKRTLRVLDFGGGDGRLMRDFLRNGHECYLLDYWAPGIPGVVKLGNTLSDLPDSERFDVIVCSHVIEHVADPCALLKALARRLSPAGVIFVEVPMEIWGRAPIHHEPVTHVNFFTPASMSRLLLESGLNQSQCRLSAYLTPLGQELLAVKAGAQSGNASARTTPPSSGLKQTRAFLHPGLIEKCWRYAAAPRQIAPAIFAKIAAITRLPLVRRLARATPAFLFTS